MQSKYYVVNTVTKEKYTMVIKSETFSLVNKLQKEIYSINPHTAISIEAHLLRVSQPSYSIALDCGSKSDASHIYLTLLSLQKSITSTIQKYTYILQNGCHFIFMCNSMKDRKIIWLDESFNLNISKSKLLKSSVLLKSVSTMKFLVRKERGKYVYVIELVINGVNAELITFDFNKLKITYMALQDALQRKCGWPNHVTSIDLSFNKMAQILMSLPKGIITNKMVEIFESDTSNENIDGSNCIVTTRPSPEKLKETIKLKFCKGTYINPKQILENKASFTKRGKAKNLSVRDECEHSNFQTII